VIVDGFMSDLCQDVHANGAGCYHCSDTMIMPNSNN